jgi:hypothetical protein
MGDAAGNEEGETMGLLDTLRSLFSSRPSARITDAIHIYVECGRCQSKVHVRLDKRHDLSQGEGGGYFVRKEIMDSKCFRMMTAEIAFDTRYRIESQEVQGGRFISKQEFEAATPPGGEA